MKSSRRFLLALAVVLSVAVTPAFADTLVVDIDPPNTGAFWTGSDTNPGDNLINSNPTTQLEWLAGLLGFASPGAGNLIQVGATIQNPGGGATTLTNFNPARAFDYVVVKYGDNWAAYSDSESDNLVTVTVPQDISHLDFYSSGTTTVPEPASLLLLGAGLLGIGIGFRSYLK